MSAADGRVYSAVDVIEGHGLAITGLAREGFNGGEDPFIKIVASRPGCLSIRSGRELVIGYERGVIRSVATRTCSVWPVVVGSRPPPDAGLDADMVPTISTPSFLVRNGGARAGGNPRSSRGRASVSRRRSHLQYGGQLLADAALPAGRSHGRKKEAEPPFRQLLRNAFLTEAERVVEEVGRLTGIDGAMLLNRDLALAAFGVILPVGRPTQNAEALDREALRVVPSISAPAAPATAPAPHMPWSIRAASCSWRRKIGQVSCLFRDPAQERVLLWRLGPAPALTSAGPRSGEML